MNRVIPCYLCLFLLILVLSGVSLAQTPAANRSIASVTGQITIGGQPAYRAEVLLKKTDDRIVDASIMQPPVSSATTDADGRYRITHLSAGRYRVSVYAPAYVIEGESRSSYEYGKTVNIAEGENVENVDFSLSRGGVITGKVTDEYGKPVIAESVGAFRLDRRGKRDDSAAFEMAGWQTDDRGFYRIFGLEAGRYIVGVGASMDEAIQPVGNRGAYKRTYHPDALDESRATIIEVNPGGEVENVDIKLARATKSYTVAGRVTNVETGDPVPGVMVGYSPAKNNAGVYFAAGSALTNSNGEFRLAGLSPSAYIAYIVNPGQSDNYADQVNFEIVDRDVTGLEIKIVRGGSISGTAVVEGAHDPAVLGQMSKIQLRAEGVSQDMMLLMMGGGTGNINPDGTFRIGGIRPGKARIVQVTSVGPKRFALARVEHNGVEVKELDVAQGEQLTNVRLVFTYGDGVLAGRVEIRGGALPPNAQMKVRVLRQGTAEEELWLAKQANIDSRGQFIIEGLSQGNYDVYLMIFAPNDDLQANFPKVKQSVAITGNVRQEITLVLDLKTGEGNK
jgi:5-hydroxyisourate hydrolase-like protein (transthyretin family)